MKRQFDLRATVSRISDVIMSVIVKNGRDVTISLDERTLEIFRSDGLREKVFNLDDDPFIFSLWEEGDFEFETTVKSGKKTELDGSYTFATGLPFDLGKVSISVIIPEEISSEITVLTKKLRGILAHEFQHVVQRVFQKKIISRQNNSFDNHLTDLFEIEARVEEVIASMEKFVPEDERTFENEISNYVLDYIVRNGSHLTPRSQKNLLKRSVKSHLSVYRKRMNEED